MEDSEVTSSILRGLTGLGVVWFIAQAAIWNQKVPKRVEHWPGAARMEVELVSERYGQPLRVSDQFAEWAPDGEWWSRTRVYRDEDPHQLLEQTVKWELTPEQAIRVVEGPECVWVDMERSQVHFNCGDESINRLVYFRLKQFLENPIPNVEAQPAAVRRAVYFPE